LSALKSALRSVNGGINPPLNIRGARGVIQVSPSQDKGGQACPLAFAEALAQAGRTNSLAGGGVMKTAMDGKQTSNGVLGITPVQSLFKDSLLRTRPERSRMIGGAKAVQEYPS